MEDIKKESEDEKVIRKEGGAGDVGKKGLKSPGTSKKNIRGGGRLHGYGPPSDKPFSSMNNKEEESTKEKSGDAVPKSNAVSSGPVPLMELGDISPPNMLSGRGRHHGNRGRGSSAQSRSERQDSYSFRGGSRRGRGGDAKPLMSLNSNEMEKHEGDTGSESQDDDTRKASKKKDLRYSIE